MNISYVITTYNKKNHLKRILDERITRLKSGDEIIVIDDGSTDGTKEMMKKEYPDLTYRWTKNQGYRLATMRNKGIKLAKNDCIIQSDDDVLFSDGYAEMMTKHYNENTLIIGAYCREDEYGDIVPDWRDSRLDKFEKIGENVYKLKEDGYCGIMCYNKQFALKIGGFDEDFNQKWGGEDTNFGHKWYYNGGNCLYVNEILAIHLYHEKRQNYLSEQSQNRVLLEEKLEELRCHPNKEKVGIIIHTLLRDDMIKRCVENIKKHCKNYRLYISDAGILTKEKKKWYNQLKKEGHKIVLLPYDINFTVGRNKLAKMVKEKYLLYVDDDFVFTEDTNLNVLIDMLNSDKDVGVVGGKVVKDGKDVLEYSFKIEKRNKHLIYHKISNIDNNNFYCDVIANFWMAKTKIFNNGAKFDESLNVGSAHSDFFIDLKYNTDWKVMYTNNCSIIHNHVSDDSYLSKRKRMIWHNKFLRKWNNGEEIKVVNDNPIISVIIPTTDKDKIITDLSNQTFSDFETIIIEDKERKGASWARNLGAMQAKGDFYFFCDDDIILEPNALEVLYNNINGADWAYGWFDWGKNGIFCKDKYYNPPEIGTNLFVWWFNGMSTMALIKKKAFIGWDEELKRFTDWDMFLRMAEKGYQGIYVNSKIFTSHDNEGISSREDILHWQEKLFKKHLK